MVVEEGEVVGAVDPIAGPSVGVALTVGEHLDDAEDEPDGRVAENEHGRYAKKRVCGIEDDPTGLIGGEFPPRVLATERAPVGRRKSNEALSNLLAVRPRPGE